MLESHGYRVLVAGSGSEALAIVERYPEPLHLLLTDVVMPRINGRELASKLVALKPGLHVISTSGYAKDLIAQLGVPDSGNAYLPKPFSAEMLAATVRELLDAPFESD